MGLHSDSEWDTESDNEVEDSRLGLEARRRKYMMALPWVHTPEEFERASKGLPPLVVSKSKEPEAPKSRKTRFWDLDLVPLAVSEEKSILEKGQWRFKLPYGQYKVLPIRSDIKVLQWRYWISRELRQILSILDQNPHSILVEDLLWIRNSVYKYLDNGTPKETNLQRRILCSVFYLLRRVNRL